jgi:hypothetical protein
MTFSTMTLPRDKDISPAMTWLKQLVASLSPRRPRSVHAGFVVDNGAGFSQSSWFSPVAIIPPWLSMLIYHLGDEQAYWWLKFGDIISLFIYLIDKCWPNNTMATTLPLFTIYV